MPDLVAQIECRTKGCSSAVEKGFVLCPAHEAAWHADRKAWPAESDERQLVRYAYQGNPPEHTLPYKPADLEPKRPPQKGYRQPPVDRVLTALLAVGCTYRPAPNDVDSWQANCPTHDDGKPSLHVRRNHNGSVWIKCWAGCSKEGILHALGLEWRDLWDASEHDTGRAKPFVPPLLPAHLRRAMEDLIRMDDERRAA